MENDRLEWLILPFADANSHGVVVVWGFERWMIHVLDPKVCACPVLLKYDGAIAHVSLIEPSHEILDHPDQFLKESPPDDFLFWKFIGQSSILFQNGELAPSLIRPRSRSPSHSLRD